MASRRRNTAAAVDPSPTEYATCTFYATADISSAFDPNLVLLRRVFFIDEDKPDTSR
jgi:hypothetical protein